MCVPWAVHWSCSTSRNRAPPSSSAYRYPRATGNRIRRPRSASAAAADATSQAAGYIRAVHDRVRGCALDRSSGPATVRRPREPVMSEVLKKKMQTATLVEKTVLGGGRLGVFKLK